MKTIRHIYLLILAALASVGAAACSDDLDVGRTPDTPTKISTGIVLRIPSTANAASFARTRGADNGLTRAQADLIQKEGEIMDVPAGLPGAGGKDLWLLIYPNSGPESASFNDELYQNGPELALQLDPASFQLTNGDDGIGGYYYKEENSEVYEIPLNPKKYYFCVVANISQYAKKIDENPDGYSYTGFNITTIPLGFLYNYVTLDFAGKLGDSILKPGELPMVCMQDQIVADKYADEDTRLIDVHNKEVTKITADMSFLCAKVRYTLLWDQTQGDFNNTNNLGPSYYLDFATDTPTASPVRSNTGVTPTTSGDPAWFSSPLSIPLEEIAYSDAPSLIAAQAEEQSSAAHSGAAQAATRSSGSVLSPMGLRVRADEASVSEQRAWQGTIYIPENYDKDKPTKLTFPANVYENADGTGTPYPQTYSLTLNGKDSAGRYVNDNEEPGVLRSNMYDIVATATKLGGFDITFSVQAWTPTTLTYDLHGPYYLEVEKTHDVEVKSGQTTRIWYKTDVPLSELKIETPLFPNDADTDSKTKYPALAANPVPIYRAEFKNDSIYIRINPAVPVGSISKDDEKCKYYNYFHVVAHNLKKRVDVYPLDLSAYLNVTPEQVEWNVREFISSGSYNNSEQVNVHVETNLPIVEMSYSWSNDAVTKACVLPPTITTLTDGVIEDHIGYYGINNPNTIPNGGKKYTDFWNQNHQNLTVTYTAKDGDTVLTKTITLNINSLVTDYIIYAKFNNWDKPHIYVYQCLEFPADTDDPNRSNRPIATSSAGTTASLEYSFTGKIAFKGWDYTAGSVNNPNQTATELSNAFWYFTTSTSEWDPSGRRTGNGHYDIMDFCKDWRDASSCSDCKNDNNYNVLWPGIRMEKVSGNTEGDWYKFVLTGVATPGKTLMMFANGHGQGTTGNYNNNIHNDGQRYPKNGTNPDPGIPLFDYPSRIGYIDLTDITGSNIPTFTSQDIMTPDPRNTNDYYIKTSWSSWGETKMRFVNGKYELTIETTVSNGQFGIVKKTKNGSSQEAWIAKGSDFSTSSAMNCEVNGSNWSIPNEGVYKLTFDPSTMTLIAVKIKDRFESGDKIRVRWLKAQFKDGINSRIYIWYGSPQQEPSGNYNSCSNGTLDNDYYYYDFKVTQTIKTINWMAVTEYRGDNSGNQNFSFSDCNLQTIDGEKVYVFTKSAW